MTRGSEPTGPENSGEIDLTTHVLDLPSPSYHWGTDQYYNDAMRSHTPPIVDLLWRLKQEDIVRATLPEIAHYTGEYAEAKESYIGAYERALAASIVETAWAKGLHVVVQQGEGAFSPEQARSKPPEEAPSFTRKLLGRIGIGTAPPPEQADMPDVHFRLHLTHEDDPTSFDYAGGTFARLSHRISIVG